MISKTCDVCGTIFSIPEDIINLVPKDEKAMYENNEKFVCLGCQRRNFSGW